MRRFRRAAAGCVFLLVTSALAIAQDNFGEELNLGTQAFRQARYDEATRHFQNAASIRPQHEIAHLYLATAYAQQYIPGVETPENLEFGKAAISEYQKVLEINPKSRDSLKGTAYLYLQMKKFADAKSFYRRAIDADPSDPETYYSIGIIDWTQAYAPRMNLLYRERAEVQCGDPASRAADLKTADHWVDLTMSTKKSKENGDHKEGAPTEPQ